MSPQPMADVAAVSASYCLLGTTHTKKYGPLEFDYADALAVMHEFNNLRGN